MHVKVSKADSMSIVECDRCYFVEIEPGGVDIVPEWDVIIENRQPPDKVTIHLEPGTSVYVMNEAGKTIETQYF